MCDDFPGNDAHEGAGMISAATNPTSRGSKRSPRLHSWGDWGLCAGFPCGAQGKAAERQALFKAGPKRAGLGTFKKNGPAELVAEGDTGDVQVQTLLPELMQLF